MRGVTFVLLLSVMQVDMLNISLLRDNYLSYCLERIVHDSYYHTHIFITSTNDTLHFTPTFSKIGIERNNLNLLDAFGSTPNLFTITYGSVVELNETLFDISARTVFKTILSHFVVITTQHEELLQISELLWKYRFYKNLILLQNDLIVELYVIDYKNSNCRKIVKYKKINSCENKKFKRKLKPIKPNVKKSFIRCSLTVGVSFTPPMILNISDAYPGIVTELLRVISASSGFNFQFNQDDCYLDQLREFRFDAMYEHFDAGIIDFAFTLNLHLTHKVFFVTT
ncbi:Ionotropic receptor 169, partial [Diabrotica virgifera virgifera]